MPTYQYACTTSECANRFDLVQAFTDPSASECPACGGPVRKVFSAVGVVFKGSGFYRNDSRSTNSHGEAQSSDSSASNGASKDSPSKSSGESSSGSPGSSGDSSGSSSSKTSSSSSGSSGSGSAGAKSGVKSSAGKAAAPA